MPANIQRPPQPLLPHWPADLHIGRVAIVCAEHWQGGIKVLADHTQHLVRSAHREVGIVDAFQHAHRLLLLRCASLLRVLL
eukprot:6467583-Amphidinium_carterae.1